MADYAIHDTTLYDIADVIRKKDGSSALIDPADYAGRVNLMGMLEEKTVSGSVVAFADGADAVKLKSCEVTIAPTLDGVSSVDVVQTGRNLLEIDSSYDIPTRATTLTRDYSNNVLHIYGEIQDTNSNYYSQDITDLVREMGTITIIANTVSGGTADLNFRVNVQEGSSVISRLSIVDTERTITYTEGYTYLLLFFVSISATVGNTVNMTVNFEADYGSSVGTYTPYVTPTTHTAALGRTIYGGTADIVNGTGTETNELVPFSDCTWAVVTSYQSNFNADNGIISLRFGKNAMATAGYAQTIDGVACNVFDNNNRSVWNNVSRLNEIGYSDGISVNLHYSDIGLSEWTSNSADTLTAWRSCQLYQTGVFSLVKATPETFTFTPTPIISRLGDNTMWSDDGDLSVVYRSSGTQTLIPPTLISKTITENGTYSAEDDNVDGYDEVTVNVSGGAQNIETVLSSNPLIEVSGVSGTDVSRTMWTYTATASGKIVFHANTQVKTNTGANDGYFTVKKNNTVIATTYANTSTTTSLVVPDIDIVSGDVVTVECGFDNYHTSAWFDIYSTITILTESTPSLLMGGFGSSNSEEESTNSETENEESNNEAESEEE